MTLTIFATSPEDRCVSMYRKGDTTTEPSDKFVRNSTDWLRSSALGA